MDKITRQVRIEHWTQIMNECLNSGMNKTEWCRANGISDKQFFYWQRILRKEAFAASTSKDLSVITDPADETSPQKISFAEISIPIKQESVRNGFHPDIILRKGPVSVEISNSVSAELLSRIGDEKNELHNRTMHISGRFAEVDIERVKVDIKSGEVDIESTKVDIRNKLLSFSDTISEKTINHTVEIFSKCGKENCFGRTIVEEITGLKPSGASKLIKLLVDSEVIVPVTGHGKGKYRFQ